MSRTREAPTPTNISTKSEPEMLKNGTLASPAMALASRVLPVPGEPTISTPRGILPPSFWNFAGSFRNSTSSCTSSLASSTPATSLKVILFCSSLISRARLLPKDSAPRPWPPPCICRMKKIHTPISSSSGNQCSRNSVNTDGVSRALPVTATLLASRSSTSFGSCRALAVNSRPSWKVPLIRRWSGSMLTARIWPFLTLPMNSE